MANCPTGSDHRQWIEYYVKELDWSLIPVNDKKIPIVKSWDEKRDNPMSIDMLLYYVEQRGCGLGNITGDKLHYVIDDDYPKHPEMTPPGWYKGFESNIITKTQNGGKHYYFKPFNMANKQNIKLPNGDTLQVDLRGSNGQVLVPPFFGYSWEKPPTKEALKKLPTVKDLPKELVELFKNGKALTRDYINTSDFFEVLGASTHRDPILFERSFVLWQNHIKKPSAYPADRIAAILKEMNEQFNPPKEIDIVEKAFKRGREYAFSLAKTDGDLPPEEPNEMRISDFESTSQLALKNFPRIDIGFPNFSEGIPSGMNLITGTPGSGKSWFSIWLIRQIFEKAGHKSVFFSLEMDTNGLMKRFLQSYAGYTLDEFESGADTSKAMELCRKIDFIIRDYTNIDASFIKPGLFLTDIHNYYQRGYRVFFFDHMHEIPGTSSNNTSSQVIEDWGNAFKMVRNTYDDVWLFVLVQPNKEGYKKTTLTKENTSGSSAILNKCDFFLSLNRTEDPDDDMQQPTDIKSVKFWIDKNRRGSMDKVSQYAEFDSTGNFEPVTMAKTINTVPESKPTIKKQMGSRWLHN